MMYRRFKTVRPTVVLCIGLVLLAGCNPRHRMKDVPDSQVQSTPKPTESMVIFMRATQVNQRQSVSLFETSDATPKFIGI